MSGPGRRPLPLRLAQDLVLVVRVLTALGAELRRRRYRAVIVGELVYGGWIGLAAKYLFRRPYVVYVHGEELTMRGAGLSERLKGFYLRRADGVVAVSRFTRQVLVERYRVRPERVLLLPNGVDVESFKPLASSAALLQRYGLAGKEVFLTVGRLVRRKGLDVTLRALARIRDEAPGAHYLIIGEGPCRAELETLTAELDLSERVTFCGLVDDAELTDHYALACFFVMPNRELPDGDTEGFGLVFLEANACGLPVIAGRAGGTGDAVEDGDNGLLVDGADVDAVAEAMRRLLDDAALRQRLGRNGLARARLATWPARWRVLSEWLERIVGA